MEGELILICPCCSTALKPGLDMPKTDMLKEGVYILCNHCSNISLIEKQGENPSLRKWRLEEQCTLRWEDKKGYFELLIASTHVKHYLKNKKSIQYY